jgi:hypothetical protein
VLPSVAGVPMDRLDAWWSSHRELVAASLAPFAAEVVTPGTVQVGGEPAASEGAHGAAGCLRRSSVLGTPQSGPCLI